MHLAFDLGLLPEVNAQDVLLEIDAAYRPTRVVFRDLMGVEKDLTIRHRLGQPTIFMSGSYKCIEREADPVLYYRRHNGTRDEDRSSLRSRRPAAKAEGAVGAGAGSKR